MQARDLMPEGNNVLARGIGAGGPVGAVGNGTFHACLQFRAARNVAFGLGYTGTLYEVDSADPDFFSGYLWIHDHGPEAFIRVSF